MEARNILIANTKTQRRYSINTAATTLGELQAEMAAQGIDFSGMAFTEGISKTQLLNSDSLLPTNVMYKGSPTNDLVILLTNTTKKIESGCEEGRTRKDAYSLIKEIGKELQEEIKEEFGRNYTQVSTAELWEFLENAVDLDDDCGDEEDEDYDDEDENTSEDTEESDVLEAAHPSLVNFIYDSIKTLTKDHTLYIEDVEVLADLITEYAARLKEDAPAISDKDIDDMIASL